MYKNGLRFVTESVEAYARQCEQQRQCPMSYENVMSDLRISFDQGMRDQLQRRLEAARRVL